MRKIFIISLCFKSSDLVLGVNKFFLQFLVDILPLGSGSMDPHIFADPDPGIKKLIRIRILSTELKICRLSCTKNFPNFRWDLTQPHWRFMDAESYKSLCRKVFDFCKIWNCAKTYDQIRKLFVVFVLYHTARREGAHR